MISILDFGAVGDGKTDNTQAIQQALDAAAEVRGTVFVPDGEFLILVELPYPDFASLVDHPAEVSTA